MVRLPRPRLDLELVSRSGVKRPKQILVVPGSLGAGERRYTVFPWFLVLTKRYHFRAIF